VAWAALILSLSGGGASSENTGSLLRLIFPSLAEETFVAVNLSVRKLGHVIGYGVLSLLNSRALLGRRRPLAIILAVVVAIIDEVHQSTIPTRTGSPLDVLLDTAAATVAQWSAARVARRREA
jgi:VanZ family protein